MLPTRLPLRPTASTRHPLRALPLACLLTACAHVLPAWAQAPDTGAASRAGVYLPEYFRDLAPANAYDMVQRVPGFVLVEADADVRGYAGASGNVLVDGVRPTSKRESTSDMLKRIPARAVERIELIHAGRPGIDMGGYPVLANIVRRRDATVEWAVEVGAVAGTEGWSAAQGEVEYGRRWDERALDLAFKYEPELDDDSGRGRIITREPGEADAIAPLYVHATQRQRSATANWRQPWLGGRLTLTAALRGEDSRNQTRSGAGDDVEQVDADDDFRESELGVRYVRQFGGRTTLEAMASRQRGRQDNQEVSRAVDEDERYDEILDSGETIARVELTHARTDALSFNASLEGAFNFLDSNSHLIEAGVPVFVPGSDMRIEEQRSEAAAGFTWHLAPAWVADGGMRLERSRLSQTGDTPLERRFTYPKPRAGLRWTRSEADQWRLSLSREVGQLDFEDFAASASLDTGTVSAGNAQLQPERIWRAALAWEHHFSEDAALTLSWTHDRIQDVVDRVLVVEGDDVFDAPGNIGDGRRDTLAVDASTPLDRLGLPGLHLRSALLWRTSRVTDPVTGERRGISEEKPFEGEIELTQELPAWDMSWGVLFEHLGERETKYRYDRITRQSEAAGWTLYAERRFGEHWRLRAEMTDLFGRDFREERRKYEGTRAASDVRQTELRKRESPGYVGITLRRSVGG